jgi:hypothetical protein
MARQFIIGLIIVGMNGLTTGAIIAPIISPFIISHIIGAIITSRIIATGHIIGIMAIIGHTGTAIMGGAITGIGE